MKKADAEFALVEALVKAIADAKMLQADAAKRIGTTKSAIARLEGGKDSPSISTVRWDAEAIVSKLENNLIQH